MGRTKQTARKSVGNAPRASKIASTVGKRRTKRPRTFKTYITRLNNTINVDPKLSISSRAMNSLDDMVIQLINRLATVADESRKISTKKTMTLQARHAMTAIQVTYPGELSKHAKSEAVKTLSSFKKSHEAPAV